MLSRGQDTTAFCLAELRNLETSEKAKRVALQHLEQCPADGLEEELVKLAESSRGEDRWLSVELRRTTLRLLMRYHTTAEEDLALLGSDAALEVKFPSDPYFGRWLAEEICSRGGGGWLQEAETLLRRHSPQVTGDARVALCRKQVSLLARHKDRVAALEEALTTEDTLPGLSLRQWAFESLVEIEGQRVDEILLRLALRWQGTGEWFAARTIVEALENRGWSERDLTSRGWYWVQPAIHALRSRQAPENPH